CQMSVRILLTITAKPGKGAELARAYKSRCASVLKEPGCEQFEAFQSADNPDRVVVLERWADQAALDVHAELNRKNPPDVGALRVDKGQGEDYIYNRTR